MSEKLISHTVVTERVAKLEKWAKEQAPFAAPESRNTATYMLAEFRDALKKASEVYTSTSETVRLTGWDRKTLLRHAAMVQAGDEMPRGWARLQVVRDGRGYSFLVSTVPVRGRKSA